MTEKPKGPSEVLQRWMRDACDLAEVRERCDRQEAIDKAVSLLREQTQVRIVPPLPDAYVTGLRKAECAKHGRVRVINRDGRAYCATCLGLCDAGRFLEVLEIDDDGEISGPELTIYPEAPINFIQINATVVTKGDNDA